MEAMLTAETVIVGNWHIYSFQETPTWRAKQSFPAKSNCTFTSFIMMDSC